LSDNYSRDSINRIKIDSYINKDLFISEDSNSNENLELEVNLEEEHIRINNSEVEKE
jgi:hypothetical protein